MKSLRNLLAALALACVLSVSAFAGDMGTQGITSTGDMGTQGIATGNMDTGATTTAPGNMETVGITATDPVTGIALVLLQSALSLF
ncbi:MAG TPA: hypothetical protein VF543_03110 [Pyrinomonadaceae bacterium]|jgi:hypothetical protein